ncbi:hypothetical protein KJ840_02440 [Patescibacteria group bacterium]|nr:hypothetical protein [Patescibacteria group bacterium]
MKKIIIISLLLALTLTGCSLLKSRSVLKPEEAKAMALEFVKENLVQPGTEVSVKEITEENGVYKLVFAFPDGQEINSYLSLDGKRFFPQVIEVEPPAAADNQQNSNSAPANQQAAKSDKPQVELFVMSHCPYGTQIEKGLLPVLGLLGDKIDFELKFCDYAMHDKKELDEQLSQYCIQKQEPQKLLSYLGCFLEAGDGASCIAQAGINVSMLNSCVAETDSQYQVTENYNAKTNWKGNYPSFDVYAADNQKYSVQGSPTLVINQGSVQPARDPQSLLTLICSGFDNPPAECSQQLSSTVPSAGFGYGAGGSSSGGDCGG